MSVQIGPAWPGRMIARWMLNPWETVECIAIGIVIALNVVIVVALAVITVTAWIHLQHDTQEMLRLSQQAQHQLQGVGNYFNN